MPPRCKRGGGGKGTSEPNSECRKEIELRSEVDGRVGRGGVILGLLCGSWLPSLPPHCLSFCQPRFGDWKDGIHREHLWQFQKEVYLVCLSFEVYRCTCSHREIPLLLRFVSSSNGVAYLSISKAPRATRAHFPIVPPTFTSPCPPSLYLSISSLRRPTFASPREKSGGNKRGMAVGECSGKTF